MAVPPHPRARASPVEPHDMDCRNIQMPNVIRLPQQRKPHREDASLRDRGARAWLKRGAALVPLAERGKVPINQGGSREPLTTSDEVEQFLAECPNANY